MGTLHVVATPIGNLEDVTLRALRVLREADLVFAEDTRRTRVLLDHHGVSAKPVSLHAHNEAARLGKALEALEGDGSVAIVSDAGTPLLSDPGERLVRAAADAGHRIEPIPGASAVLVALAGAGLRAQPFTFLGFLPRKIGARRAQIEAFRKRPETLIVFESPRRLANTLREFTEWLGEGRRACVARELTKLHEEFARGTLAELAEQFAEGARGEVTLVIEGAELDIAELSADELDDELRSRVALGQSAREIAADLAPRSGRPRRELYARVLELRDAASGQRDAEAGS
ncbi:MAG: 16S rRNA (cytidine(1402)-2'-O)-methyltransferase [Myxococcota bacterium]|nr:16S rRNA (cytidine(1402)-2'-O)-methyltransferase [Myxococcota bacterium]